MVRFLAFSALHKCPTLHAALPSNPKTCHNNLELPPKQPLHLSCQKSVPERAVLPQGGLSSVVLNINTVFCYYDMTVSFPPILTIIDQTSYSTPPPCTNYVLLCLLYLHELRL